MDGSLKTWTFAKNGQKAEITVDGPLIYNDIDMMLDAALDGMGIGYFPEPMVAAPLRSGELVALLDEWSGKLPGVHLYHPSRHQTPMPLQLFLKFAEKWRKSAPPTNRTDAAEARCGRRRGRASRP